MSSYKGPPSAKIYMKTMFILSSILNEYSQIRFAPSPHKWSLWTTAFTLRAKSCTALTKILVATWSQASAQDTTSGTSAAMRAQDGSA